MFQTDVAAQRDRYVAFLLDALDDPDGRVRIAAADAFNLLAVGLGMADLTDELARIAADLETLAALPSSPSRGFGSTTRTSGRCSTGCSARRRRA